MEDDPMFKKAVLRRAVELIPTSVKLWKELVSLESMFCYFCRSRRCKETVEPSCGIHPNKC